MFSTSPFPFFLIRYWLKKLLTFILGSLSTFPGLGLFSADVVIFGSVLAAWVTWSEEFFLLSWQWGFLLSTSIATGVTKTIWGEISVLEGPIWKKFPCLHWSHLLSNFEIQTRVWLTSVCFGNDPVCSCLSFKKREAGAGKDCFSTLGELSWHRLRCSSHDWLSCCYQTLLVLKKMHISSSGTLSF